MSVRYQTQVSYIVSQDSNIADHRIESSWHPVSYLINRNPSNGYECALVIFLALPLNGPILVAVFAAEIDARVDVNKLPHNIR